MSPVEIHRTDQVAALLHPVRQKIMDVLARQTATPSEVARIIGLPANKVHYHVNILHKAELVVLTETRKVGSVTEKYFRAVAEDFHIDSNQLDSEGVQRLYPMVTTELKQLLRDFRSLSASPEEAFKKHHAVLSISRLRADETAEVDIDSAIEKLRTKYAAAKESYPGRPYRLVVAFVPMDVDEAKEE